MKKVIGIISLLLSVTLATANPIDFDKAFKESAKIEKQIKRTSFPNLGIAGEDCTRGN